MTLPSTLFDQNSAPDLDYRFSEIEITLSWFPSHSFKLFLIDGLLYRLLSFCLYHLDSSFLVLMTIILTTRLVRDTDSTFYLQWKFIALFDLETFRLQTMWRHCICKFVGEDYEFLAVAVQDIRQRNYSQ